jgi:hypothetical protein
VANDEAEVCLFKLKTEELNLKSEIFSGKMIKFEESEIEMESKSVLGQLKFENIIKGLHSLNFDELKTINLADKLTGKATGYYKISSIVSNQNFVIAFQNSGSNVNLLTIDHQENASNKRDNIITYKSLGNKQGHLYDLNLAKFKQGVIVYFHYFNLSSQFESMIQYRDDNLNLIKQMIITKDNNWKNCISTDEDNIFILSNPNSNLRSLSIYDSNLTLVQTIGQSKDVMLPFYFSLSTTKIAVSREYFFWLDSSNELTLVNKNDGKLFTKFKIASNSLFIHLNKFIISYYSTTRTLYFYDFNGKLYTEQNLTQLNDNNGLIDISSGELTFLDTTNSTLNYFN